MDANKWVAEIYSQEFSKLLVPASGPKIPDEILRLAIVKSPSAEKAPKAAVVPEGVPRMRDGRPKYEGRIFKHFSNFKFAKHLNRCASDEYSQRDRETADGIKTDNPASVHQRQSGDRQCDQFAKNTEGIIFA